MKSSNLKAFRTEQPKKLYFVEVAKDEIRQIHKTSKTEIYMKEGERK